jgi:N-carbamoyl-L-amino-acid hydrolase
MQLVGIDARADHMNSVFGRLPGGHPPWLLIGSHTDTVPAGGRLDGAYGVIAALEVLRALSESDHPVASGVEVVSFHDEEGVVGSGGLTGSRALVGNPHLNDISGYIELHIEQGPVLEDAGDEAGVVEAIVGVRRFNVTIEGEANHAGTTPYSARHDAGAAAAKLTWRLRDILHEIDPGMVGNVGVLSFHPGSPNVVPGRATLIVEIRSVSTQILDLAQDAVAAAAIQAASDFRCRASVEAGLAIEPVQLDAPTVYVLTRVCERAGVRWRLMASGAAHDAGVLAARVPAGMLFVPSHRGISHSPMELTDDRLLVQGAELLLAAVVELVATEPSHLSVQ